MADTTSIYEDNDDILVEKTDIHLYAVWKRKIIKIRYFCDDSIGMSINIERNAHQNPESAQTNLESRKEAQKSSASRDNSSGSICRSAVPQYEVKDSPEQEIDESNIDEQDDDLDTGEDTTVEYYTASYSQQVQKDTRASLLSNKFSRIGYEFAHWSLEVQPDIQPNVASIYQDIDHPNYYIQELLYNDYISEMPTPSMAGYTFLGWFTAYGVELTSETRITDDIIVYARWRRDGEDTTTTVTPSSDTTISVSSTSIQPTPGLDPERFQVSSGSAVIGAGLCGNIIYCRFYGNGKKNCKLYHGSSRCNSYCTNCSTKAYSHPDAPGKVFYKIGLLAGTSAKKPPLKEGCTDQYLEQVMQYIQEHNGWRPGRVYTNKQIYGADNYDWEHYGVNGADGKRFGPVMQWPGHEFEYWFLCYDGCHGGSVGSPMETLVTKYINEPIMVEEIGQMVAFRKDVYVCSDYLQYVRDNGQVYRGFCFYPQFKD